MGKTVVIDGKTYKTKSTNKRIFTLTHGLVMYGEVAKTLEDGTIAVNNSKIIRRWGTTKGIGELKGGALENTRLDGTGDDVHINPSHIIFSIPVEGLVTL